MGALQRSLQTSVIADPLTRWVGIVDRRQSRVSVFRGLQWLRVTSGS